MRHLRPSFSMRFIAANLMTILVSIFFHFGGVQSWYVANSIQSAGQIKTLFKFPVEVQNELEARLRDPAFVAGSLFRTLKIAFFTIGTLEAVRKVFRLSLGSLFGGCVSQLCRGVHPFTALGLAVYSANRLAIYSADGVPAFARLLQWDRQ